MISVEGRKNRYKKLARLQPAVPMTDKIGRRETSLLCIYWANRRECRVLFSNLIILFLVSPEVYYHNVE